MVDVTLDQKTVPFGSGKFRHADVIETWRSCREEEQVHRRADGIRVEAGRVGHACRGGLPQDGDQRRDVLHIWTAPNSKRKLTDTEVDCVHISGLSRVERLWRSGHDEICAGRRLARFATLPSAKGSSPGPSCAYSSVSRPCAWTPTSSQSRHRHVCRRSIWVHPDAAHRADHPADASRSAHATSRRSVE